MTRPDTEMTNRDELPEVMCASIPVFTRLFMNLYANERKHGLPVSQIQILLSLKNRSRTVGELSRMLGIAKPNVSPAVDKLEKLGFVVRRKAADDRRVVLLTLTEEGSKKAEVMFREMAQSLLGKTEKLTERAKKDLAKSICMLVRVFAD